MKEIIIPEKYHKILEYVQSLFDKEVFAVGGCVRDMIMGNKCKDWDFCSSMSTEEIKEQIKGKHKAYCIGEKFGTIGFHFELDEEKIEIELTTFRKDEKYGKSRKPEVTFCDDLMEDLKRRDFTLNAIALDVSKFLKVWGRKENESLQIL